MQNLNSEQKRAALTKSGPVLVLAGAGAGKTKTLSERIRQLVASGMAPSSILAITFTNKAAREMRERVEKMLDEDKNINLPVSMLERPFVSTFHSLGVHILREWSHELGIKKHFTIFDRDDSKAAVKEALLKNELDPKLHDPGRFLAIISKEKGRGITIGEYGLQEEKSRFSNLLEVVWDEYEKTLRRDSALDFDDLLLRTRDLLRDSPKVREYYRSKWQFIHIDEYQDTNRVQYDISKHLTSEERNIFVVGDIDQSIYSWRGADIKNILDFEKDYPDAAVIVLEENYRSTKNILNAANVVIEKNRLRRKKNLFTSNSDGELIGIYTGFDEGYEAEFIATRAKALIQMGCPPEEIAVLYRANFQSRVLEEAFLRHEIPYQLLGTKFFERKEVKDVLAYLRAALNPESLSDMKRIINVPTRGIGKTTIAKIFAGEERALPAATLKKVWAFRELLTRIAEVIKEKKPSDVLVHIIKTSGLEESWKEAGEDGETRLENAYELANFASRFDSVAEEFGPEEATLKFMSDAALQSDQDEMDDTSHSARLMTVHASKGLEFDTVFVAGLEDGLFPHQKVTKEGISPQEAEEERRLFYVALTRARKKVFLSYAQTRTVFGRRQVNIPSEFIFDIPEELTEEEKFDGDGMPRKPLLKIDF
ncbi:MAG: UvrD-helicase domain-containing protein [bacterium]|nr:UvrD-helicase domain-containing protein [bacterium]